MAGDPRAALAVATRVRMYRGALHAEIRSMNARGRAARIREILLAPAPDVRNARIEVVVGWVFSRPSGSGDTIDRVLSEAGIARPFRPVHSLTPNEVQRIYLALTRVRRLAPRRSTNANGAGRREPSDPEC